MDYRTNNGGGNSARGAVLTDLFSTQEAQLLSVFSSNKCDRALREALPPSPRQQ